MANLVTTTEVTNAWAGFASLALAEQLALIGASSRRVERYCDRVFEFDEVTETLDGTGLERLWLARPPVDSITSVTIDDDELDNSNEDAWTLYPETGELVRGVGYGGWWPPGRRNIEVVYEGGYETIPDDVKRACVLDVRHLHGAVSNTGILKSEKIGEYQYTLGDGLSLPLPPVAAALLAPFRGSRSSALDDLLINAVTVARREWSNDHGERTPSETEVELSASVQPMSASRRQVYGLDAGVTGWTVYFAADPAVNALDTIAWGDHVLSVLAPARDEAGRGVVWTVDCTEVA